MINRIFNESNIDTMQRMGDNFVDGIICSPPYNISTKRKDGYYNTGYSDIDNLTAEEYIETRKREFLEFERIVKNDGVILYNISYVNDNPILPFQLIEKIHSETNLTLADVIYWKKKNSMPFQSSRTNLSRIVEPVYVFVNKQNLKSFKTNKEISKINEKTNQKFYKHYTNYIEAKNNDSIKTKLKATYSSELVTKLINIYFTKGSLIYDPFSGIGTTAVGCKISDCNYIGSEIKEEFYLQSIDLIKKVDKIKDI